MRGLFFFALKKNLVRGRRAASACKVKCKGNLYNGYEQGETLHVVDAWRTFTIFDGERDEMFSFLV